MGEPRLGLLVDAAGTVVLGSRKANDDRGPAGGTRCGTVHRLGDDISRWCEPCRRRIPQRDQYPGRYQLRGRG